MRLIRAIIADDEETLRSHLRKKLSLLWPELVISGEAKDGIEALRLIENVQPDIAFLDIKMPGLSGIEVGRKTTGKCSAVFVTAYDQYAVEAFENEALDYLLKPVTDERLEKTIKRLKERIASPSLLPDMSAVLEKAALALQKPPEHLQWIKARHRGGIRLIPCSTIYFFKAKDKYTAARTRDGEFLIRKTIKELSEELDPDQFWRVHRGAIVNVKNINMVGRSIAGRYVIILKDIQERLSVSRAYFQRFRLM
jgi:DNA-binding LytR/AlgR family response regulator